MHRSGIKNKIKLIIMSSRYKNNENKHVRWDNNCLASIRKRLVMVYEEMHERKQTRMKINEDDLPFVWNKNFVG